MGLTANVDFFKFDPWPTNAIVQSVNVVIETSNLSGGMDTVIDLYSSTGSLIASNDDAPGLGLASRLSYTTNLSGILYVRVRHYNASGTGGYSIRVTRP